MFIDVHCHLDYFSDEKISDIIEKCRKNKVNLIVANGTNPETNRKVLSLSDSFPEVFAALGIYPIECLKMNEKEIDEEISFMKKMKKYISAIGEVGVDLKESGDLKTQLKNLKKFTDLSKNLNIPIIIHSRKAEKETIDFLEKENVKKVVMHHFSGNFKLVRRIFEKGWHISIPTSVVRSEHFQKIILEAPLENLLCETDSPFLHPKKSGDNDPSNVIYSYKKISEIKKISIDKVAEKISNNFKNIFNL